MTGTADRNSFRVDVDSHDQEPKVLLEEATQRRKGEGSRDLEW